VYRCGGEEFLLLLPDGDHHDAAATAERIRRSVADIALHHRARPTVSEFVPFGVEAGIQALVAAPIRSRGSVLGAVSLYSGAALDAEAEKRAGRLAAQAAGLLASRHTDNVSGPVGHG
jgi:GGDEF domain-containing protein